MGIRYQLDLPSLRRAFVDGKLVSGVVWLFVLVALVAAGRPVLSRGFYDPNQAAIAVAALIAMLLARRFVFIGPHEALHRAGFRAVGVPKQDILTRRFPGGDCTMCYGYRFALGRAAIAAFAPESLTVGSYAAFYVLAGYGLDSAAAVAFAFAVLNHAGSIGDFAIMGLFVPQPFGEIEHEDGAVPTVIFHSRVAEGANR